MKVVGLLNLFDSPSLGNLTKTRTLASTSFLGRFTPMDFSLSNFANSGIDESNVDETAAMGTVRGFVPYFDTEATGSTKIPEALCINKGF